MQGMVLVIGLALIFYFDGRYRKIPNKVLVPMVAFGFLFNTVTLGIPGFMDSLVGSFVGLALLFIPFALQGVGAGDVKLLAAIGALQGYQFVLATFLYGAVIGGIWAMIILIRQGVFFQTIKAILWNATIGLVSGRHALVPLRTLSAGRSWGFPYGIAMGIGALIRLYWGIPL